MSNFKYKGIIINEIPDSFFIIKCIIDEEVIKDEVIKCLLRIKRMERDIYSCTILLHVLVYQGIILKDKEDIRLYVGLYAFRYKIK